MYTRLEFHSNEYSAGLTPLFKWIFSLWEQVDWNELVHYLFDDLVDVLFGQVVEFFEFWNVPEPVPNRRKSVFEVSVAYADVSLLFHL